MVKLTATVTAGTTPVTPGQVEFCDAAATHCEGIHLLGLAQLTSAGTATIKFVPAIGSHSYKAVFLGTANAAGSSSAASALTVTGIYSPATSIGQSGSFGSYTLTATVGGTASVAPTGLVSFLDTSNGNAVLGTASLGEGAGSPFSFLNRSNAAAGAVNQGPIAVGDFNGDGIPDLAVTDGAAIKVLIGNGDGTFTAGTTVPIPEGVFGIAVADFNGDGKLDLAVVSYNNSSDTTGVLISLLGNGDGTFSVQPNPILLANDPMPAPGTVVVGDFNQDGIPDLAVLTYNNTVSVFLGQGDGTFAAGPQSLTLPSSSSCCGFDVSLTANSIVVADFNGDGIPDLAVASDGAYSITPGPVGVGTVTVFLGNGDGTFNATTNPFAGLSGFNSGFTATFLASADFNGDGVPDLAVANGVVFSNDGTVGGFGTITILLGKGDGTFNQATNSPYALAPNWNPDFITVGDFNGDGVPDLALEENYPETEPGSLEVLLGNGDGTFGNGISLQSPALQGSIGVGDFTGDGIQDLAVPDDPIGKLGVFLGSQTEVATASAPGISLREGLHQLVASYPGDSNYGASTSGAMTVSVPVTPITVTVTPSSSSITLIQPLTVTVTLSVPADNPTPTGSVTVTAGSFTSALATLSSGSTTITVPAGSLALGSDTLTANYTGDSNYNNATGASTTPVMVVKATPTNLLASSANPAYVSNPVTFTATVSSSGGTPPTGAVSFYDGTSLLGSGTLSAGAAAYTTSALTAGSHSIAAVYSGDSNFVTTTSSTLAETVEDFTLGAATGSSSATVSPGGQAVYTLAIDPPTGTTFAGAITFSVSGLPAGATGVFAPATIAAGAGATNVTLTVTVSSASSLARPAGRPFDGGALPVALGLIVLPFAGRLRRTVRPWKEMTCWLVLVLAGAALAVGLTGCVGSSTPPPPPQNYTLTITAASGSLSHSTTVILAVE
jgi:hypothetical protein